MKIRKFQAGGYALTYAAPAATPAATGGTISLTELMAPFFRSAATKLFSLATSAAPAATAVAIPVALTASGIYGAKANQKQVEKGMMPFITSPHASLGYQQTYMSPKKEITVPSEPLVLRPEYRTETYVVPDQYNPIKSIIEVQDSQGNRKFVDDSNLYGSAGEVPNPKKPQKNDNKKPFFKTTPGKILK